MLGREETEAVLALEEARLWKGEGDIYKINDTNGVC